MMAKLPPTKTIDDAISRCERRLEGLRQVRELLHDDPQFANELVDLARSMNGSSSSVVTPEGATAAIQVESFFGLNNNRWATVREIADRTGILSGTVSYVLYDKVEEFLKRDHPTDARKKQWKLAKGGVAL